MVEDKELDLFDFELKHLALAIRNENDFYKLIPEQEKQLVNELKGIEEFMNLIKDKNIEVSNIGDIKKLNILLKKTSEISAGEIKDEIQFLLEEYINLIKLEKTADYYLFVMDLENEIPLYGVDTAKTEFLDKYSYGDILKTYERKIKEVREQRRKQREERRKQKEEQLKQQLREEQRINKDENSVYNPMLNGGRRSTQKRKKTIRKKTKNKKRTRRFR